jgi:hypothetical protein
MSDTIQSAEVQVKPECAEEFAKDFLRAWVLNENELEAIKKMISLIKSDRAAHIALGREMEHTARAEDAETISELDENWLAKWFASKKREHNVLMGLDPLPLFGSPVPPSHYLANFMGRELKKLIDEHITALSRLSVGKVEPWSCDGCVQFGCQACARFYNDLYSPITPSGKE